MTPDLPETYYLDNVLTLFAHVERVYGDILGPQQVDFLCRFAALGEDAKKLYIRLLNRNHTCFRRGKLNYSAIGSIDAAIHELQSAGCLELNPPLENALLLSLYTRPELLALADDSSLNKLKRAELEADLLQHKSGFFERLQLKDDILRLNYQDEYQLCQMLFFGNLNQSMTDFVLRDLGLNQYENYHIDPAHRPYRSSLEIRQHWLLQQLEVRVEDCDASDSTALLQIATDIPRQIGADAPAWRHAERLRYAVARQLERNGELDPALEHYQDCLLPPCRERIARIHAQQGRPQQSLEICVAMIEDPIDDSELHFACQFGARLIKRHRLDAQEQVEQRRITHKPDIVKLEIAYQESVEIAVAEHYDAQDGCDSCYFLENSLFNGVLGLLLWDVIFAPLPGAFYNPFQHRPADFYAHDFFDRRAGLCDDVWASIDGNDAIWRLVKSRWQQKFGLMNPLVNWQGLDLGIIELALERIEHTHWRAVFERILADLRGNRAGFPDLIHFPPAGGYCLIEVKGPGDSLQKNQQRWMQYFQQHGIPHKLAKVTWKQ